MFAENEYHEVENSHEVGTFKPFEGVEMFLLKRKKYEEMRYVSFVL